MLTLDFDELKRLWNERIARPLRNALKKGLQVIAFATVTVMGAVIISLLDVGNWSQAFHTFIMTAGVTGFFIALLALKFQAELIAFAVLLGQITSQLIVNFLQGQFAPLDHL